MMQSNSAVPNLLTIRQFSGKHPAWTEPSLRWLIFNELENGLNASGAILRLGRKVLIDEAKFFDWVHAQQFAA